MEAEQRSLLEVLRVFLKLGPTSFGGPVGHLGRFRNGLVVQRRWLDERALRIAIDEKRFRWMLNEDQMATEKISEGIRIFNHDPQALRTMVEQRLAAGASRPEEIVGFGHDDP